MSIQEGILKEIERETKSTRSIIKRFEDQHLDWRPHPKSMSVRALAYHVIELQNWVALALPKDRFDFHKDYQRLEPATVSELLDLLDQGLADNLAAVERMQEADWFGEWTLCAGDHVIAQFPNKLAAFRFIIQNHLIHHRGQLSVYLRLLDLPVPGIYGPSADDKR